MNNQLDEKRQRQRLLAMFVAVLISITFITSVFFREENVPDVVVLGTAVSVVGMFTGALWLAVRWNRHRNSN
jgi:hypothetical protein